MISTSVHLNPVPTVVCVPKGSESSPAGVSAPGEGRRARNASSRTVQVRRAKVTRRSAESAALGSVLLVTPCVVSDSFFRGVLYRHRMYKERQGGPA